MGPEQLLEKLARTKKSVDSLIQSLRKVKRMDQDRSANLSKLKREIEKIQEWATSPDIESELKRILLKAVEDYRNELERAEEASQRRFGSQLERELMALGFTLSGQYPNLKAGMFLTELDFDRQKVKLWLGPKQELVGTCALSATVVAKEVGRLAGSLGSGLEKARFIDALTRAYRKVLEDASGLVPITRILPELAFQLQKSKFHQDPRREHYQSYSRADFAYDLYTISGDRRVRLKTATRSETRRRKDFLWVPRNEKGDGTVYSQLHLLIGDSK